MYITISNSVMNIGYGVFDGCSSLTSVTSIGYRAFTGCAALTEIHVVAGNANYASEDGVLFDQAKTILLAYPEGKPEAEYVIPESVTSIGDSAFYGCDHLISMTLPDRIETVGSIAFWGCENLLDITVCNPSCDTRI